MSKRSNESGQMRREEYEAQEEAESEDAGTFKKAGTEVLKARRIVSASRRYKAPGDGAAPPVPTAPAPAASGSESEAGGEAYYKSAVIAMYNVHNPAKLSEVDNLMAKYKGREPELLLALQRKYVLKGPTASEGKDGEEKGEEKGKSSNPFAGFTGLTKPSAEADKAPSNSNPFAGFTGLTAPPATAEAEQYPMKATCDVSPRGKPCGGAAEAATVCSGTITFLQKIVGGPVTISWNISGLSPGKHGFHIHEKADFSDGCNSAGPHWNPHGKAHGGPCDAERHAGDLGNITAGADGRSVGEDTFRLVQLGGEFSVVGRSVMVHADEDDLGCGDHSEPGTNGKTSKTTGNAGARIACGEIIPQA